MGYRGRVHVVEVQVSRAQARGGEQAGVSHVRKAERARVRGDVREERGGIERVQFDAKRIEGSVEAGEQQGPGHQQKSGVGSVFIGGGRTREIRVWLYRDKLKQYRLTIADGGSVVATNIYVGFATGTSTNLLDVSGGNLVVTNASGTGLLNVRAGVLTFNGGTITAEQLWLTNGGNSIWQFNSGTLHTKGTMVSNTQPCVVGDGVASGNFHLVGGVHSFQNGLHIRTNSFLTGCGTVNGSVVVDAGGAVHANCTNLVFNSALTNNGTIVVDGAVLETFGTFVNNGKMFLLNGGTTNLHGTFVNNGAILSGKPLLTISQDGSSGFFVRYTGAPDIAYRLQRTASVTGPWSDIATNTAPASGVVEYHETAPPQSRAFYRTVQP